MNVVWGSFGFLLIAIGWIMTSERAWIFLHEHKGIRVAGIVSIILIFVFNIYTLRQAEQTSAQLLQFMGQDPYVSSSIKQDYYYRQYKVPPFYLGVLVNSPLFIYLGYMVYVCGLKEPPRGEGKVKKTSPESEL
ncbi:MAG: hypothetical protein HC769_15030 [Cyanobacteria bacterium CRU_2_1]|nr:hypothetical protein [Cyanobacteria bacterium CRU_2_1]